MSVETRVEVHHSQWSPLTSKTDFHRLHSHRHSGHWHHCLRLHLNSPYHHRSLPCHRYHHLLCSKVDSRVLGRQEIDVVALVDNSAADIHPEADNLRQCLAEMHTNSSVECTYLVMELGHYRWPEAVVCHCLPLVEVLSHELSRCLRLHDQLQINRNQEINVNAIAKSCGTYILSSHSDVVFCTLWLGPA